VLFLIELSTRKVEIAGLAPIANRLWMSQIGLNLTDAVDGILKGKRYLIHDRDPLFTSEFLKVLVETGVASVKLQPRSPRTCRELCAQSALLRPTARLLSLLTCRDRGQNETESTKCWQPSPVLTRLHALRVSQSNSRT